MSEFPAPPPLQQSAYPTGKGPSGPRAGFWRRFAAWFLDALLLAIVELVLERLVGRGGVLVSFVIAVAYFTYLEGSNSGQTIGKRALGIRVIDFSSGGPIGYGRAIIRYFGRFVSGFVLLLGYFWMLWDKERQTWHDKFANDVVVPVASYPVARWPN